MYLYNYKVYVTTLQSLRTQFSVSVGFDTSITKIRSESIIRSRIAQM